MRTWRRTDLGAGGIPGEGSYPAPRARAVAPAHRYFGDGPGPGTGRSRFPAAPPRRRRGSAEHSRLRAAGASADLAGGTPPACRARTRCGLPLTVRPRLPPNRVAVRERGRGVGRVGGELDRDEAVWFGPSGRRVPFIDGRCSVIAPNPLAKAVSSGDSGLRDRGFYSDTDLAPDGGDSRGEFRGAPRRRACPEVWEGR